MILIIGAKGQGKSSYIEKNFQKNALINCKENRIHTDCEGVVLDHLEELIYQKMLENKTDSVITEEIMDLSVEVFVCDEIGGGPVSMSQLERRYIELTGRICCLLAQKAEKVVRLYCGIAQTIKGA